MPERRDDDVVGVLLADPWSFPADGFVGSPTRACAGLPLVGGLASGAAGAGSTRLLLDGNVIDRGAVGVVVGGDVASHTMVARAAARSGRR